MSTTGFSAIGTAYETCVACAGVGSYGYGPCSRCQGLGRVPVPLRGITDPDDFEEREDELKAQVAIARAALGRLIETVDVFGLPDQAAIEGCREALRKIVSVMK